MTAVGGPAHSSPRPLASSSASASAAADARESDQSINQSAAIESRRLLAVITRQVELWLETQKNLHKSFSNADNLFSKDP